MLLAAGAVWGERWVASLSAARALIVRRVTWRALAVSAVLVAAVVLPIAPVNSRWWGVANKLNDNFNEEIGWPDLVEKVAATRDSLPVNDRNRVGILASDSGEAGAINLYGPAYGLPRAISGMNSHWLRGYGDPPQETLILIGFGRDFAEQVFESCEFAGYITNRYGIVQATPGTAAPTFRANPPRAGTTTDSSPSHPARVRNSRPSASAVAPGSTPCSMYAAGTSSRRPARSAFTSTRAASRSPIRNGST
jgi:hypothetical protein